jgi:phage tail-like protein
MSSEGVMDASAVGYTILRDRRTWAGDLVGLQAGEDCTLTLARVPGLDDGQPIVHPGPHDTPASGLAVAQCRDLYIADTSMHTVSWIIGRCPENKFQIGVGAGSAPGQFNLPRGLALDAQDLFVADSGNARVQVFRLPSLELRAIWEEGLNEPTCLACDSKGRVYVLDVLQDGRRRILRLDTSGVPDFAYNDAMSHHAHLAAPAGIAINAHDVLHVSDEQSNEIECFDAAGAARGALTKTGWPERPQTGGPERPRCLTTLGDRLYAADAKGGKICVHHAGQGWLGTLPDYSGPVSALTLDEAGTLYIKPRLDAAYEKLAADRACVSGGTLTAGPFDAGEPGEWARVKAEADRSADTTVVLRVHASSTTGNAPSEADWAHDKTLVPSLDALVPPLPGIIPSVSGEKRYLWIRVSLQTRDPHATPRLRQVSAHTRAESYLNYLPAVYRREDAERRLLERWLALFQGELGDWELALDDLHRSFDPLLAPEHLLPALSQWLAFDLPHDTDPDTWRQLLQRAHALYDRRGTPSGIREFAELYAGVRPHLFEAFHERRVWQLDSTSLLGFDTALAAATADGMVVSGFAETEPALLGLRGDYYDGINFDRLMQVRIDPVVDFDWKSHSPIPETMPIDVFSVRWSGQVQPEHSEIYTFHTLSDDGVRLWVAGRLLVDNWTDHGITENRGKIALNGGRWYPITLEYYEKRGGATIRLSWSSRSLPKQIVPQERLYAIPDETARLADATSREPFDALVGETVVGASGPLAAADFGTPLFSDTAHLFTVVVPAGQIPDSAGRERLRQVIEAEKPVHTDFHLCFVEPRMRVGLQARVGVDSIVAGPRPPLSLHGTELGVDSYLGEDDAAPAGRVGQRSHVGQDTIVG